MHLLSKIASGSALLVFATALGVITAVAAFAWVNTHSTGSGTGLENPQLVVVVRGDVPAGTVLPASMLQLREVPKGQAAEGALDRVEAAAGRVARYPLVSGEQVVDTKLVPKDQVQKNGLAYTVPPGMRALSVPVAEESSAGGLVVPGDHVDVLVSTEYARLFAPAEAANMHDQEQAPAVLTVLQNVLVLAVGQELARPSDPGRDAAAARPDDASEQPHARSMTLAVQPDNAQILFMASQHGTIGISLRPFGEDAQSATTPLVKLQPAVGGSSTPTSTAAVLPPPGIASSALPASPSPTPTSTATPSAVAAR